MPTSFSKIPIAFWIFDNPITHRRYLMLKNKMIMLLKDDLAHVRFTLS